MKDPLVIGTITIELIAGGDGDLVTRTNTSEDLPFITAVGMLDMARGSLDELYLER